MVKLFTCVLSVKITEKGYRLVEQKFFFYFGHSCYVIHDIKSIDNNIDIQKNISAVSPVQKRIDCLSQQL